MQIGYIGVTAVDFCSRQQLSGSSIQGYIMFTSSIIKHAYQSTAELRYDQYEEKAAELLLQHKGNNILLPLTYYLSLLAEINPLFFAYWSKEKRNEILRQLQVTSLLLITQKKYELAHQKTENRSIYSSQLKKCAELIDTLQQQSPEQNYGSTDRPVAFLAIVAGHSFAQQMVALSDSKSKTIKEFMGGVNEKRLYWVWSSSFLKTILASVPADFFNLNQAQQTIRYPDPYTGTMSWALYYFRFALSLGLLLKHTIAGPWMSKEEKNEPWTERFQTQWRQRKFTLLNDSIWATGNLVCFFWLVGKGLGTWGDMLTIALLVFDLTLAVWDYEEQKTRYAQQMNDYTQAIDHLKKQITVLTTTQHFIKDKEAEQQRRELELQCLALERAKEQCDRAWRYQKVSLVTGIAYAVGLMLAFTLLAAPFFPLAAGTIAALSLSGAVLCLAFSVINNAIKGGIELHKTKATIKELHKEYQIKSAAFDGHLDEAGKKLLFLELKKLTIDSEYQEKMLTLNAMKLARSIIIETFVPAVVFVSLIFLPLGPGLGVLAAALALAIATHYVLDVLFKPKQSELKELDEQEFQDFCNGIADKNNLLDKTPSFFQPSNALPLIPTGRPEDQDENQPLLGGLLPKAP